jgi:hypothetical protein
VELCGKIKDLAVKNILVRASIRLGVERFLGYQSDGESACALGGLKYSTPLGDVQSKLKNLGGNLLPRALKLILTKWAELPIIRQGIRYRRLEYILEPHISAISAKITFSLVLYPQPTNVNRIIQNQDPLLPGAISPRSVQRL